MNEGKKNFQGKRQDKRRKIAYLIKNNQIERRKLTLNEIIQFYNSIKENNLSKFGIIKLSELKLEEIFYIDNLDNIRVFTLKNKELNEEEEMTLMKYAINQKRNKIIGSLIRGGYDPSVYPKIKTTRSSNICNMLTSFPLGYTIWLIYQVYEMIEESFKNYNINQNEDICHVCSNNDNNENNNYNENNNDNEFIIDIQNFLLTWKPCGHKICYKCTWSSICTPLIKSNYSLRCPQCNIRCDGGSDEYYLIDETKIHYNDNNSNNIIGSLTLNQLLPIERSTYSYNLWLNLPSELDKVQLKENKKRPEFIVGPIYEVSKYLIGTTKEQRILEFHRGIVTNHIYRLYWIFYCGINVNGKNKYGQTPLMISIISNHLQSLKFLLWCGADVTITDHIQSNLLSIAFYHKKEIIYNYLRENISRNILESFQTQITSLNFLQNLTLNETYNPIIVTLISTNDTISIDGRGSCYVDNCFSDLFLNYLDECLLNCPLDLNDLNDLADYDYSNNKNYNNNEKNTTNKVSNENDKKCSNRYYIYDSDVIIRKEISKTLEKLRSIYFQDNNGNNNRDDDNDNDGENKQKHGLFCTNILPTMKYLKYSSPEISLQSHIDLSKEDPYLNITSTHTLIIYLTTCESGGETVLLNDLNQSTINIPIQPVRGRLLIFPHHCPHKGETTIHFPKTLLRCEAY